MFDWKRWFKAAGIRAIRTFAQTLVAMIGGNSVGIVQIDWLGILSVAATAAVVSMLTSVVGLPELDDGTEKNKSDEAEKPEEITEI